MVFSPKQALQHRLDAFSARLHRRTEQFRTTGEFSDTHRAVLGEIQQHRDELNARVQQAEEGGSTWELLKSEVLRDVSSLEDDLERFEDELDSDALKKH